LIYGTLSSLLILSVITPAKADTQPLIVAQSNSTVDEMFRQQRVLKDDIQALMTDLRTMMAEMKALSSLPSGKTATMNDLYKQQQLLAARFDSIVGRTRLDTIQPRATSSASVQEVHQQQVEMLTEMKAMMAEMKRMIAVYRGRVTEPKQ
jgi:hypothetical protein